MTNSSEQRLDRIEAAIDRLTARQDAAQSQIEANASQIQANTAALGLLSQRTEIMAMAVERSVDVQLQTLQRIDEMQQEVRELQTENRRIMDHLFGQRDGDESA